MSTVKSLFFYMKVCKLKTFFSTDNRRFFFYALFGSLMACTFSAILPTWVREKNRFLFDTNVSSRSASYYFLDKERIDIDKFRKTDWNIYADYGVTKNYTLGFYIPAIQAVTLTEILPDVAETGKKTHTSHGDLHLIQRLQIANIEGVVFNFEFLLGLPTGNHNKERGFYTDNDGYHYMPGFSLGWGFSLFTLPSYITLSSGYNFRTGEFSDEIYTTFSFGAFIYKKSILLNYEHKELQSIKNKKASLTKDNRFNNTSYSASGLGFIFKFTKDSGLSIYYKTASRADNILGGPSYSIGTFFIF